MYGFYRISALSPRLFFGDVQANVEHLRSLIHEHKSSGFILFPELCLTGYSLQDLFFQENLAEQVQKGLQDLAGSVMESIVIVGAPLWHEDRLYNCAVVLYDGKVRGIVPKTYLANYREFYEKRWFSSGKDIEDATLLGVPFGVDLLFEAGEVRTDVIDLSEEGKQIAQAQLFRLGSNLVVLIAAADCEVQSGDPSSAAHGEKRRVQLAVIDSADVADVKALVGCGLDARHVVDSCAGEHETNLLSVNLLSQGKQSRCLSAEGRGQHEAIWVVHQIVGEGLRRIVACNV